MATIGASSIAPMPVEGRRARIVEPKVRRSWAWAWVVLLTVAAAVLRFWALDRPAIWGDEAAVYWRTCGTYAQLLEILKNDGFAPLHYELYWVIHQFFTLTPRVMRFIPALSAVLMVPTMYWLPKQLVGTRAALVVATFTAVSAHLGWHAHDAKMYSHFWLFCALNMACFIWWLRRGGGTAWWCWAASGVAMVGLHSTGFAIVALQPLMLLCGPRRNWRVVLFYLLGVAVISVGPLIYYLHFNQWAQNIESKGWDASGIAWVETINGRSTPAQQLRLTITQLLFGYDFPGPWAQEAGIQSSWRLAQDLPVWLGTALLAALFPWPMRARGRGVARLPQPWWRSAFYLGAWLILPVYAFYCASFKGYPWPGEILISLWQMICSSWTALFWTAIALLAGGYFLAATNRDRLRLGLQGLAVAAAVFLLAECIAAAASFRPPGSVWITRYMSFVWPAATIAVVALLLRLPGWPIRWLMILLLIGANLLQCLSRIEHRQDAPLDLITADILLAREPDSKTQAHFLGNHMTGSMQTMERRYYLFMTSREKATPDEFRGGNVRTRFRLSTAPTPASIVKGLTQASSIDRLIIWEQLPGPSIGSKAPQRTYPDRMAKDLPAGWQRVSEELHPFAGRWGWAPSLAWRRCEYRLVDPPATTPAE